MTTNDSVEKIFNMLYENRYQGLGTGKLWFALNGIIASDPNFQKINFQNSLLYGTFFTELLKISKYDIEFYTRSMNYTIQESLTYLEYFFMKCSLYILFKKYDGLLDSLYDETNLFCRNIYGTIYEDTIEIILDGEYQEEIEISENTGKIYIGKNPRSIIYSISSPILKNYKANILDLLNKKCSKEALNICENLGENKLLPLVNKLNIIYQQMNAIRNIEIFPFSVNSEDIFPKEDNLNEEKYDELLFKEYDILFFPLINDVKISDNKISVFNEGNGSLQNGILIISYNGNIIINKKIKISHDRSYDFYLNDEIKRIIKTEDPNNTIEFKIIFQKFGQMYTLIFNKEIGIIKETLEPDTDDNMKTININNVIGSTIVSGSNNVSINNHYPDKEELSEYYKQLIDKIDNLRIEEDKKETIRDKFHYALEEVEKANADYLIVKKLTQQAFGIIGSHISNPLLGGIALKLKEIFNI